MKNIELKFSLKELPSRFAPILKKVLKYGHVIFIVTALASYSFLVWRINSLSQAKPSQDQLTEKLNDIRLPKIDQSVVDKLKQLEDNSVEVKSLLDSARENPFHE